MNIKDIRDIIKAKGIETRVQLPKDFETIPTPYVIIFHGGQNVGLSADNEAVVRIKKFQIRLVRENFQSVEENEVTEALNENKIQWELRIHKQDEETNLWYTIYEINTL